MNSDTIKFAPFKTALTSCRSPYPCQSVVVSLTCQLQLFFIAAFLVRDILARPISWFVFVCVVDVRRLQER